MAVAVTDDAERFEPHRPGPGLLRKLPAGRALGPLAGAYLPARELPESSEQARRGPTLYEPAPAPVDEDDDRRPDVGASGGAARRDRAGVVELPEGAAGERDGAGVAAGRARDADSFPELHERLVERAAGPAVERLRQGSFEPPAGPGSAEVPRLEEEPGGDPESVRLERDDRSIVGEGGDRPGDVRADARQPLEFGDGAREAPVVPRDDLAGGRVEVARPGVVTGPFPELQDATERCPRERLDGRERVRQSLEVGYRLRDAGLLEEDLGEPDPVRVAISPPGKGPTVPLEPPEERGDRRRRERRGRLPTGRIRHGRPSGARGALGLKHGGGSTSSFRAGMSDDGPAPIRVTDESFDLVVVRSPLPVVVDFTANWCAPCRITRPTLNALSERLSGRVMFATVDVDEATRVTRSYGIHSLPTFLFVQDGHERGREVGPFSALEFRTKIRRHFAADSHPVADA